MCGICGKLNVEGKEISEELIRRMSATLAHRGPDDEGIYISHGSSRSGPQSVSIGLGHKRLSIIDLAKTGHQPMANESKTVWIVFNGEIYGFDKLKKGLERRGHRFSSKSDCEVIIHLYEEEGIQCLKELNGMFAFALWDSRNQALYLVRDRLGIKPLVYSWDGTSLIFASEIKSVLQDPGISKEMDGNALELYLTFNYVPAPFTIFKGIRKLLPGYYLAAKNGSVETRQYWDVASNSLPDGVEKPDFETCKEKLRDLLEEAVRMQLIADVPLGAFLSGGLDSSILVGLMSRISNSAVNTYSIGFKDMPLFDETRYSREVAEFNHTNHHEILLTSQDVLSVVPEVLRSFDEPFGDSSAVPTYIVSRETKKDVKVAVSGDGADELFAGYRMYAGEYWYSRYRWVPRMMRKNVIEPLLLSLPDSRDKILLEYIRRIKKFTSGAKEKIEERFYAWNEIFSNNVREKILIRNNQELENLDFDFGKKMVNKLINSFAGDRINRMLYVDLKNSLPNDMLTKVDLMSMKNALEVRVPFLDHRLAEYVFQLPGNLKLKGRTGKYVLREAFKDILPPILHKRAKQGFEMPISQWLKSDLKFLIHEYLAKEKIERQRIFHYQPIEKLIRDLFSNRSDTSWQI